jgi:hypothetical protein
MEKHTALCDSIRNGPSTCVCRVALPVRVHYVTMQGKMLWERGQSALIRREK